MVQKIDSISEDWVGMWDRENRGSIWNRVPGSFREAMDSIPDRIRGMDEKKLFKRAKPPDSLQDARFRFWDLFWANERARIPINNVFMGNVNAYETMIRNHYRLMFFLTPPADFSSSQKSILERTMKLVRSTLTEGNLYTTIRKVKRGKDGSEEVTETRELNVKVLAETRKLMEVMSDRLQGAAVQRVQHAHSVLPGDRIGQLTSVESILDIADDRAVPFLGDGEVVELAERLRNDISEVKESIVGIPPSADLSEFLDEDPEFE